MSFVLQEDNMDGLSAFYDGDLGSIIKAPSLGSNQTLVCPYTMLAHYHEPDDVLESLHLSRYLIRLSVGSEPTSEATLQGLKQGLDRVLDL